MELYNQIEAILFTAGNPVPIDDLARFFELSKNKMIEKLNELKKIKESTGLTIKIFDNIEVQLVTAHETGESVLKYFHPEARPKKLTKAAIETISIIAYNQPITKSEIEHIRGVNVEKVIATLDEKNMIRVCGRKNSIGSPNLYEVTEDFLNYIGIKSITELPKYEEVKDIVKREN